MVAVVDDDDAVRESLRFLLEAAGFPVSVYASAAEFLNTANPDEIGCLVLDQHMPQQTGLQLVTRLRGDGTDLPIALITGSPSPDLIERAKHLGVQMVLEKPLADDVLLDFVAHAIH
jgi:FixJ family two-component response regulator